MQLHADQERFLRLILTNTRIIAAALINGVVFFLVIVVFVLKGEAKGGPLVNTYASLAVGGVALILSYVIPNLIGTPIKRALVEGKTVELPKQFNAPAGVGIVGNLLWLYQTRLIVGYAILEGAAFYNLVAHMLERQSINLAMVGLLIGAMLTKFPTRRRLDNWLADEMKSIEELRSLRN
jgi:hypothetical protein